MTAETAGPGLVLDIQAAQSLDYPDRGIARYVQGLALALLDVPGLVRGLLLNPAMPFCGNLHHALLRSSLLRWNTAGELRRLRRDGPLAYFLMSPMELGPPVETVLPDHVLATGIPLLATLYDLVPLRDPARHFLSPQIEERYRLRVGIYSQADLVLAISDSSRRDAIELLGLDPQRVVSIGGGVSSYFAPAAAGDDAGQRLRRAVPAISGDYVLYVSGTGARKNTERLIDAWGVVPRKQRSGLQLVIACRLEPEVEQRWRARAAAAGLDTAELVLTGFVDDATLRDLYRCARLLVFASEFEGYGLPIAEAIACGCPAITSNTSASPEVLDMPGATFDPHDAGDMARCIGRALAEPGMLERLRQRAAERLPLWTWDAVAARTVTALDRVPRPSPREPRLRIGLVGDPHASASLEAVVTELAAGCRLEVFSTAPHAVGNGSVIPVRPAADLLRSGAAGAYDAVIYAVTGTTADRLALELSRHFPGVVWFCELDCAELSIAAARDAVTGLRGESGALRGRIVALPTEPEPADAAVAAAARLVDDLRELYGDRLPQPVVDDLTVPEEGSGMPAPPLTLTRDRAERFGLLAAGLFAVDARALVTGSEASARRLRLDLGPLAPAASIHVASGDASAVAATLLDAAAHA